MEKMNLAIKRNDFEEAIPVATTKNNDVFEMIESYIDTAEYEVAEKILGEAGVNAVNNGQNVMLVRFVKRLVCYNAFLPHFRSLDLVLTATGFGVVSTQDLTPASKARVDALKSQLDIERKRSECRVIEQLFSVKGWAAQRQRKQCVPTLFYDFNYLSEYAGVEAPTINDWRRAQPLIMEADGLLRSKIGNGQMDSLLTKVTSGNMTAEETTACTTILNIIGLHIAGNPRAEKVYYTSLMNHIEAHLDVFSAYRDSEAYQTNHFKGYENTKESGMFIFQG